MSDDGHRDWVAQNKTSFIGVTIPVAFLNAHAEESSKDYAEQCMTSWKPSRRPGPGRKDLHIAAASTLATHVRHTISRESQ